MNPRRLFLAVLFLGALWSAGAPGSEVFYRELDLPAVVERANLVVMAERAQPFTTTSEISIVPEGRKPDADKYPPYSRVKTRWVVREVLKSRGPLAPGSVLEIDAAHWDSDLGGHRLYYVEGISESPIYTRYKGTVTDAPAKAILFLSGREGALQFVVQGALEAVAKRDEVRRLITTPARKTQPKP